MALHLLRTFRMSSSSLRRGAVTNHIQGWNVVRSKSNETERRVVGEKKGKKEKKLEKSAKKSETEVGQKKVKNQKPVDKNKPIIEYLDADIDEVRQRLVNLMTEPMEEGNWQKVRESDFVNFKKGDITRQYLLRHGGDPKDLEVRMRVAQVYSTIFGSELRNLTNRQFIEEGLHRATRTACALQDVFRDVKMKKFAPYVNLAVEFIATPQDNERIYQDLPLVVYRGNYLTPRMTREKPTVRFLPATASEKSASRSSLLSRLWNRLTVPKPLVTGRFEHFGKQLKNLKDAAVVNDVPDGLSPALIIPTSSDQYHTLMMLDLDSPSRTTPMYRGLNLWTVTNIPGSAVHEGEQIVSYCPPLPCRNTGMHRIAFYLFEQRDGKISVGPDSLPRIAEGEYKARRNFKLQDFSATYALKPCGVSFFQAGWDETVPETFKDRFGMEEPVFLDAEEKKVLDRRLSKMYRPKKYQ